MLGNIDEGMSVHKICKYLRRSTGIRVPAKTAEARLDACGTAMSSLSQARLKVDEVPVFIDMLKDVVYGNS